MELLSSPKSTYLLDAGLEVLHAQSIEWLNDIAFWKDEADFFYALVVSKTLHSVPIHAKNKIETIEKGLINIAGGELDDLKKEVENHEHFLKTLLQNKREDQEKYRDLHHSLASKFDKFSLNFKMLKKEIFELAELSNKK